MKRDTAPAGKGRRIVQATPGARGATDFARLDAMTDEDIAQQIAENPDAAPEATDEWFDRATWVQPEKKVPISLRVDPDVLAFFKGLGEGYQSRMNAVLRSYAEHARRHAPAVRAQEKPRGRKQASAPTRSARPGESK